MVVINISVKHISKHILVGDTKLIQAGLKLVTCFFQRTPAKIQNLLIHTQDEQTGAIHSSPASFVCGMERQNPKGRRWGSGSLAGYIHSQIHSLSGPGLRKSSDISVEFVKDEKVYAIYKYYQTLVFVISNFEMQESPRTAIRQPNVEGGVWAQ